MYEQVKVLSGWLKTRLVFEIGGAFVGLGWAWLTASGWHSGMSLAIPDLGISIFGVVVGAAIGYGMGLFPEMTGLTYRRRIETVPSEG